MTLRVLTETGNDLKKQRDNKGEEKYHPKWINSSYNMVIIIAWTSTIRISYTLVCQWLYPK